MLQESYKEALLDYKLLLPESSPVVFVYSPNSIICVPGTDLWQFGWVDSFLSRVLAICSAVVVVVFVVVFVFVFVKEALSVLMLCVPSNHQRPFSYFHELSIFS